MPYKVSIHNRYKDGFELKAEFDTNSALLHAAMAEAEIETVAALILNNRFTQEKPIFSSVTYKPV